MASVVACLAVNDIRSIAEIAAYTFTSIPTIKTKDASPGRLKIDITGEKKLDIIANRPEILSSSIIIYTGINTLESS